MPGQLTVNEIVGRRIGVVDDDEYLRRAVRRLLHAAGYSVRTFGSAEEFLAMEPMPAFDCLVLDIRLPQLSGFDLYERLRAAGVSIPAVFVTGHDDAATREQARRTGAAGYVPKPFADEALITAIERAASPHHQKEEDDHAPSP
jgi:FixJ family two-component response regulator